MPHLFRLALIVLLIQIFTLKFLTVPVIADTDREVDEKASRVKLKFYGETGVEYSDNVFQLSESQKENLETPDLEDVVNGRFDEMESATDVILVPLLGVKLALDSPFGGDLALSSSIQYNIHGQNTAANFPEAKLEAKSSAGENGRISLEFKWLDGYFKKNYLSGVNDTNGNGNISKDERIYSAAVYDEYEGVIAFRQTVLKREHELISRIDVEPFVGWSYRIYNSDFSNRNKRTLSGGLSLGLELLSRLNLEVTYVFEDVRTPDGNELVLFDETIYGIDVNNDGEIEAHAALATAIDRSCGKHSVEIAPAIELTDACSAFFSIEYQWSYYRSDNELDIDHYDQWVLTKAFKAGMVYDISKNWSAKVAYEKEEDDTIEDDYTENRFMASLEFSLGKWSPGSWKP
jgi:hypothetical protein